MHGTVSRCPLVEGIRVVATSGSAELGDDRIREVKAGAVGGECRPCDRVVVHSKFLRVQKTVHQLGTPAGIHLVGAARKPAQRRELEAGGDELHVLD